MSTNDPAAHLFTAVHEGDEDVVVRLLRSGVSPDAVDEDGQTALYLAAVSDRPGVVRLLLVAGAAPDRLSQGTDAPLCGAACGGHTEVVRALLAAGAAPDTVEEFGFTALTWAVRLGRVAVVRELLAAGADPDRPGPTGEPPLVAAARRGSPGCVRALLRHGARARSAALAEAHRRLTADVETEVRAGLEETWGPGRPSVTHRYPEDGGTTVEVQLLDPAGNPVASIDQQTGHAAIATLLESALGITAPAAELAARALRPADPDNDDWTEAATALGLRGDEETFRAAVEWCAAPDPLRQAFGADVLGRLGNPHGLPILRVLSGATDPVIRDRAASALARLDSPARPVLEPRAHGDTSSGIVRTDGGAPYPAPYTAPGTSACANSFRAVSPASDGVQRAPLSAVGPGRQPSMTVMRPPSVSKTRPVTPLLALAPSQTTRGRRSQGPSRRRSRRRGPPWCPRRRVRSSGCGPRGRSR